jgi:uroporphyrinogen-III decarboxylase
MITAKYFKEMGFNLFNFSFEHGMGEIRELAGNAVTLLGNIPPRDVLANGTPEQVEQSVAQALSSIEDKRWIIFSAGGGVPPSVPTANIDAFYTAVVDGQ